MTRKDDKQQPKKPTIDISGNAILVCRANSNSGLLYESFKIHFEGGRIQSFEPLTRAPDTLSNATARAAWSLKPQKFDDVFEPAFIAKQRIAAKKKLKKNDR